MFICKFVLYVMQRTCIGQILLLKIVCYLSVFFLSILLFFLQKFTIQKANRIKNLQDLAIENQIWHEVLNSILPFACFQIG